MTISTSPADEELIYSALMYYAQFGGSMVSLERRKTRQGRAARLADRIIRSTGGFTLDESGTGEAVQRLRGARRSGKQAT